MGKRFVSLLLTLCMIVPLLPVKAAAATGITMDTDRSAYSIYANGNAVTIRQGATEYKTLIYLDGQSVTLTGKNPPEGDAVNGYDLRSWTIYGGSLAETVSGDTSITMESGAVYGITGGGNNSGKICAQNTNVTITGGYVECVNGGGRGTVPGTATTRIGGNAQVRLHIDGGGDSVGNVDLQLYGNATVSSVYGGGMAGSLNDAVAGNVNITVKDNATVSDSLCALGYAMRHHLAVNGTTTVNIQGGTVQSLYGGPYLFNNGSATAADKVCIYVTGGTVGAVCGGGRSSDCTLTMNGEEFTISGGAVGNAWDISHQAILNVSGDAKIGAAGSSPTGIWVDTAFQKVNFDSNYSGKGYFYIPENFDVSGKPTVAYGEQAVVSKLGESGPGAKGKGIHYDSTIKLHNHALTSVSGQVPNCTENGWKDYEKCTICGDFFTDTTNWNEITNLDTWKTGSGKIAATGHAWGAWETTTEPTCTAAGEQTRTCGNDAAHKETRESAALGHTLTKTEAVDATCTTAGNRAYWTCSRCNKVYSDAAATMETTVEGSVIEPTGHTLGDPATCTIAQICTTCRAEIHPALGHNLAKTEAVAATCTTAGNRSYWTCSRCNAVYSDAAATTETTVENSTIAATGHAWSEWETTTEPTCTAAGEQTRVCGNDNSHIETKSVNAIGHAWGEWKTTTNPTCTADGEQTRICGNDNTHIETQSVAAIGHAWGEWETTTDPTCTADGEQTRVCNNDNTHIENQTIAATGHRWGSAWEKDNASHWHPCQNAGCPITDNNQMDGYGTHIYTDDHDASCNVCGYVREVEEPTYSISGVVTKDGSPLSNVTVILQRGHQQIGDPVTTGTDGRYSFSGVTPGDYNVIATTQDGKIMTILVKIVAEDATEQNIAMPSENVNSVLNVKGEDTPDVVVGGLEAEAEANKQDSSTVTVTMTVESKDEAVAANAAEIKTAAGAGKKIDFLEIKVEKKVETTQGGGSITTEPITTTSGLLQIIIPFDFTGKDRDTVAVYRYHADQVDTLAGSANPDGEYIEIGESNITLRVKNFSTYAIGYAETRNPPVPSGSGTETGGDTVCPKDETCPIWPYTDAKTTAWYHDGVHYCIENSLMMGYGNGKFAPNSPLSRGMLAQILYNKENRPEIAGPSPFADVKEGVWFANAVIWAAENDIVAGYGNGKYGPNDPITREQLATILWRHAGSPESGGSLDNFTDGAKTSGWAAEALKWAVEKGIVVGKGNGILDPKGNATRAETASIILRYFESGEK